MPLRSWRSLAASVFICGGSPDGTPKRLRLPSFGWRLASLVTLIALIGCDPAFDGLWTAGAACGDVPNTNLSNDTIRITNFSYDLESRLAQVDSPEGYINYEYDLATGRHISTCTANSKVTYDYDSLGRLWKVNLLKRNGTTLGTPETTTYTYTAVGSRETVRLPNNTVAAYFYDHLNRLTNLTHTATNNVLLASYSYQLHPTGRRTNATEVLLNTNESSYVTNTHAWAYDGLYRLTNEVSTSTSSALAHSTSYEYDKAGNRWKKVEVVGSITTTTTNQFNGNDQLLKEVTSTNGVFIATNTYAYDANGSVIGRTNLSSSGTATALYDYDLKNKMSSVTAGGTTTKFNYNNQGIRVRASVVGGSTKYFLVDANNHTGYAQVLEEFNVVSGTPTLVMSYTFGDDVLGQATASTVSSLLYDGHGSARHLLKGNADVTAQYNYDAYGQSLKTLPTDPEASTSLLYCGEQYDSTLKMYNLRARFYDPSNGRFNAMDTFMGYNEDPQSLHKYAYAHCDPGNGIDPSGHSVYGYIALAVVVIFVAIAIWAAVSAINSAWQLRKTLYTPPGPSKFQNPFGQKSGSFKIKICADASHVWIDVTHVASGERHTFGRCAKFYDSKDSPIGGVNVDEELNRTPDVSRTRTINSFNVAIDQGYDLGWDNCATFARKTWERNAREDIDSDTWIGIDRVEIITEEIREANGNQNHHEVLEK